MDLSLISFDLQELIGQNVVVVREKIAEETKQNKTQFFNVLLEIDELGMMGFHEMDCVMSEWKESVAKMEEWEGYLYNSRWYKSKQLRSAERYQY